MMTRQEASMADHFDSNANVGEAKLAGKRRKFWLFIAGMMASAMIIGAGWGVIEADGSMRAFVTRSPELAWIGIGLAIASMSWFSIEFFRRVDELETADNLWASLVGFYVYVMLFPAWWALEQVNAVSPVNNWAIYWTAAAAATLVYVWRKIRMR